MNREKLRFKGYSFNYNPNTITVKQERRVVVHCSPLCKSIVQDVGVMPLVVTGEGELFGENVMLQFERLSATFASLNEGLLCLPDMAPFTACFCDLTVVRKPTPNLLKYSFRFMEVR